MKSTIGWGAWGEVNSYIHRKTDYICAGKLMSKNFIRRKGEQAINNLKAELKTLDEIDH